MALESLYDNYEKFAETKKLVENCEMQIEELIEDRDFYRKFSKWGDIIGLGTGISVGVVGSILTIATGYTILAAYTIGATILSAITVTGYITFLPKVKENKLKKLKVILKRLETNANNLEDEIFISKDYALDKVNTQTENKMELFNITRYNDLIINHNKEKIRKLSVTLNNKEN